MVLVILSALAERCFVFRMRDLKKNILQLAVRTVQQNWICRVGIYLMISFRFLLQSCTVFCTVCHIDIVPLCEMDIWKAPAAGTS